MINSNDKGCATRRTKHDVDDVAHNFNVFAYV